VLTVQTRCFLRRLTRSPFALSGLLPDWKCANEQADGDLEYFTGPARSFGTGVEKAVTAVDADTERLTTIFKDIHQHPELGIMETRTAGIVAKELQSLGFDVKTGIGKTGVVAILKNGSGPTVIYRADMDANAVEEASDCRMREKCASGVSTARNHLSLTCAATTRT
jgi:hypothetical protein